MAGTLIVTSCGLAADTLAEFDFVVEKVADDYAGYDTKITDANRQILAAPTSEARRKAETATYELVRLLQDWVAYFRDRHLRVDPVITLDSFSN